MEHVSLEQAISSAQICSGENAPDLENMNGKNALQIRNAFLQNVCYNGRMSHAHIIIVLQYMAKFFPTHNQSVEILESWEDLKNECELNGLESQTPEC
jgi:hypothetical protein